MRSASLFSTILLSGLTGGLMFGWTVSVIPGLRKVADAEYVSTMQSINREIINPGFVIPFVITPAALAMASTLHFRSGETRRGWLLAIACVVYVLGVMGVTGFGNVPLNDTLDQFDLAAATTDVLDRQRSDYEMPWNRWHYARTAASIAVMSLTISAAIVSVEQE